eukprot:TRINITY_DN382_c0_g1_i1.p2 TRINITY_DN382_c0_g1~~TRINITY_DN382_c0_g1_i1.p2  ORF type:complete len:185 (-),score=35.08 TRINITY_DN382_c0_g1_i1:14-568(-)
MKSLALITFVCLAFVPAFAQQIVNGGFEVPACTTSFCSFTSGTGITGWTLFGWADQARSDYWQAACGNYSIDLNGGPSGFPAILQQDVTGLSAGTHFLNFSLSGDPYCGAYVKNVHVVIQGSSTWDREYLFDTTGMTAAYMGYRREAAEFYVPQNGDTVSVTFISYTFGAGATCGPVIDCVEIN